MSIKLKVEQGANGKFQLRGKRNATNQFSFYTGDRLAVRLNQFATLNRRSIFSILEEMVEFCLDQFDSGEAAFEQEPSTAQPAEPVAQRRSKRPLTEDEEIAAQTLRDRMGNVPNVTEAAEARRKANLRGMGYVVKD